MKRSSTWLLTLLTLPLFCPSTSTAAVVVNVEARASFMGSFSGQGAYTATGNYWNSFVNISGGSNLLASDGSTVTGISFSAGNTSDPDAGFGGGGDGLLLADYWYVHGTRVGTFTLGGLTAGNAYQVYVYSQAGSSGATDRAATITLGGASQNLTGLAGAGGSLVAGQNYVVFNISSLVGTSLSGTFATQTGSGEAELNGLQIINLGAGSGSSTVPDTSTSAWLLGFLLLGSAAAERRLRATR